MNRNQKLKARYGKQSGMGSRLSLNRSTANLQVSGGAANYDGAGLLFPSGNGAALTPRGGMEMQRMKTDLNGKPGAMARDNKVAPQITIEVV